MQQKLKSRFRLSKTYLLLTVLLFLTEVYIGKYVHDAFVRPYVGDFLVVILLYCLVQSFIQMPVKPLAVGVLLFSYVVEVLQYLNIVKVLGLENNSMARIIIGTAFAWSDILAYTLGILLVVWIEKIVNNRTTSAG
ncbi:Protein of unknown function [Filimonas lacunae]|uniref:DUF2809 domain-containing protein n=1 Tax=Filimonas lacunae TaxID=477680 RepID=A0A173M9F7_9BACT|nr:DUF2809 domain-containing protein [Filimonas lacunae]BAV04108.1 hypothetical protein FLA_0087 [Filimonas lacunae]SIT15383.1 Protein of unknown function [Filimonas lacunae]